MMNKVIKTMFDYCVICSFIKGKTMLGYLVPMWIKSWC